MTWKEGAAHHLPALPVIFFLTGSVYLSFIAFYSPTFLAQTFSSLHKRSPDFEVRKVCVPHTHTQIILNVCAWPLELTLGTTSDCQPGGILSGPLLPY